MLSFMFVMSTVYGGIWALHFVFSFFYANHKLPTQSNHLVECCVTVHPIPSHHLAVLRIDNGDFT